ncbi:immunity 49 family protein [Nocardia sp. NPDC050712]|uniref:immunity 49 family protein n=1 Tax=Nocardia sp. NPDC050712 TaxID=3155518 RepID=UPI0033CE32D6
MDDMIHVERHLSTMVQDWRVGYSVREYVRYLYINPSLDLDSVANEARKVTGFLSLSDTRGRSTGVQRAVFTAAEAKVGRLRGAGLAQSERFTLHLDGLDRYVNGTEGSGYAPSVGDFRDGLWFALVCRNTRLIDFLTTSPIMRLRHDGYRFNDYHYLWMQAWQEHLTGNPAFRSTLGAALQATDPAVHEYPEDAETGWFDYATLVARPALTLLGDLARGDGDVFNANLEQALIAHREHWKNPDVDGPDGLIAWPLLAVAGQAVHAGITVVAESDYLPATLMLQDNWAVPHGLLRKPGQQPRPEPSAPTPANEEFPAVPRRIVTSSKRSNFDETTGAGLGQAVRTFNTAVIDDALDTEEALKETAVSALSIAGYLSIKDPEAHTPAIRRVIVDAAMSGTVMLQGHHDPDGQAVIPLTLDHRPIDIPAGVVRTPPTIADFLRALWPALVARDSRSLNILLGTPAEPGYPLDAIDRNRHEYNDYWYLWAEAWQKVWVGDPGQIQPLVAAENAAVGTQTYPDDHYGLVVAYPAMNMLFNATQGRVNEFNTILERGLEDHGAFWNTAERERDPYGYIAWPLLAAACYATDRGIPIRVRSDYLPASLLRREWTTSPLW